MDADQIYNELVKIVTNKGRIQFLSKSSQEYVERVYNTKVVAQKYIDVFEQYNG